MSDLPRRTVLCAVVAGAAAAPLAACGRSGDSAASPPPAAGEVLAAAADIAVGSGIVAHGTLISQPSPGVFEGFVARCTHAGCALGVLDGEAVCPCHGSRFAFDGAVTRGPATQPLVPRAIAVKGTEIVVTGVNSPDGDPAEPIR